MAKIETVSYSNETFKSYLMTLSKGIVWKNSSLAKEYDTESDPYLVEIFITANRGALNFDVIRAFPRAVLRKIGVSEANLEEYASDKNKIPTTLRQIAVDEYQEALCSINPTTNRLGYETPDGWVTVYEEKNNYYRMLNGLPDLGETNFVYNTDPRWDTTTPVHELRYIDRLEMEEAGVLDTLLSKNPSAKYLRYCGSKMINIFKARVAERFDILWRNSVDSSTLESDFDSVYDGCCNLVNSVYFSEAFRKTNTLYENFLAMSILFMTIQTMQYHYLSVDVIRDFYDTESLKYVYDSYSVPFYNEIPLEYHRKIVKNINKLIGYKGSSQVFFDLFDIFNINMDIYSYYLTRVHKFDEHGNPTFIQATDENGNLLYDEHGNPVLSNENYKIYFSKGEIYADPALSVANPTNFSTYESVTVPDPYWIEDAELQEKLDEASYNFTESKYIGVQTTFDLIRISYENAYLFKMIMDNKEATDKLTIKWIDMGIEASLYEIFLYLAALVCKYHGYAGIISPKVPYTAAVLGYDFKASATIIQDNIEKNEYLKSNSKLKELISKMVISNAASVDSVFENMQDIEKMLVSGYVNATTKEEFDAYRDLYNTLMTSKMVTEVYCKGDGEVAESFMDLLRDQSPELYSRLMGLIDEEVEDELNVLVDRLQDLITSLRYAPHSLGIESSRMIECLFRIISFFKSAKAEMIGYNIIYRITERGINFFKILDGFFRFKDHIKYIDLESYYYDFITYVKSTLKFKKDLMMIQEDENMSPRFKYALREKIEWTNDMLILLKEMMPKFKEETEYQDFIMSFYTRSRIKDYHPSDDKLDLVDQYFVKGAPVATLKDPFVFVDMLVYKAALPYFLLDCSIDDFIHYVNYAIHKVFEVNEDNLIQRDELRLLYSGPTKDIMDQYILKEISRVYKDTTVSSKMSLLDKVLFSNDYPSLTDIGYGNGIPGDESLIQTSENTTVHIGDGCFMRDSLTLSDGTPL